MGKFIKILLLASLPFFAQAQVNGTIQKTVATGTIRGSFGSSGIDTIAPVSALATFSNGHVLIWDSSLKKFKDGGSATSGTVTSVTAGNGLTPNTAQTTTVAFRVDTSAIQTVSNFFPKGDTRYQRSSTAFVNPMTNIGDLIQGTTSGAPVRLASVATGNALISGGVNTASSWGKIGLATHVSGTLPIANGGTGSGTQNFVDLTSAQLVAGNKEFSGILTTRNVVPEADGTRLVGDVSAAYSYMTSYQYKVKSSNTSSTKNLSGGAFSSDYTILLPNASGTIALTSNIPSVTPSALTKTDDTNVTLTLGGTPSTALLQPTSITAGWTGTLSTARGGTGNSTGNAVTATALATPRTIGTLTGDVTVTGSSFDGSANNTNSATVTKVNGVAFSGLATGLLKNTTSTGVPSIAVAGTDYLSPSGSGASLSNVVNSITGTSNQVVASGSTGAVTLSLPQSIATSSTPTFNTLTLSTTSTSIPLKLNSTGSFTILEFQKSGVAKSQVYLDNTTERLNISGNLALPSYTTPGVLTNDASGNITSTSLTSGTYTPTLTNGTNVASSSAIISHYTRIANEVTVTGQLSITTTAGSSSTNIQVSLPVASNLGVDTDLTGDGVLKTFTTTSSTATIGASSGTDTAVITFISLAADTYLMKFSFTYTVI